MSKELGDTTRERLTLLQVLRKDGVPLSDAATATPLAGGVSSEIYRIEDGDRSFVVKRALERLKVADDWRADLTRNRYEQRYLRYVGSFLPGGVPHILFAREELGYFGMEYLGEGFVNWKTALLGGDSDPRRAREAMQLLAQIHNTSRGNTDLACEFDSTPIFHQLRTDPYLLATARRHPSLASIFQEEAGRLEATHECLVHGDFSPKNILLGHQRLVLLDCEVAWYGDPAFDVAFLLNHLCLKALYHTPRVAELQTLFDTAVKTYFEMTSSSTATEIDRRSARLLLMLLLARIDGKSPVEYICDETRKDFIREFVTTLLPSFQGRLNEVSFSWFGQIGQRFPSV